MKLTDDLRELRAPGEGEARGRAWDLAAAAHAERPARAEPRRRRRRALVLAPALALVLAAALTPPGEAVGEWVGRTVRNVVDPPPPRPAALGALPGGGRLLVLADRAPVTAGDRGRHQLLGAVDEATWSGHGHFIAAARGIELIAVDLAGRRRWHVAAPAPVRFPRWSPDGFRIAYFAGNQLRVVAGDGTNDRLLARAVPLAPAWRPRPGHVLAHADTGGQIVEVDPDRARVLFRVRGPRGLRALAFSPAGYQLLALGRRELRFYDSRTGRLQRRVAAPAGTVNERVAYRRGGDFALVRRRGARSEVVLVTPHGTRRLFAAGRLGTVAFSPRGDWLLVEWRETDSWLFLPVGRPAGRRPRQITGVARRFGTTAATPVGWCCP